LNSKNRTKAALILNLAVIVLEVTGACLSYMRNGIALFRFYTEDSNFLMMAACIVSAIYLIREIRTGSAVPHSVRVFKYTAMSCLAMTFIVVIFVLAPFMTAAGMNGYQIMMLSGSMLYMHFICPVVSFLSYMLFESGKALEKGMIKWALLPTIIYAAIAYTVNIAKLGEGPYPFFYVYRQPVYASILWLVLLIAVAYILARVILRFSRHSEKSGARTRRKEA